VKVVVVTFPGSNCDQDCHRAVTLVGGEPRYLWHREHGLDDADAVILPGGFSYGDYLRAGAIARFSPAMEDVARFAKRGGPVLAICNGFQIACEAGLLPGALMRNQTLRFHSFDQHLRVENADTMWTSAYQRGAVLRMPVAHAEGNYEADEATLDRLEGEGLVLFRYVDADGNVTEEGNPNGSAHSIAGIVNPEGNVMGMMPHPDRVMEPLVGSTDGRGVFESLLRHLESVGAAR
jgi:phosphoribosylformylglycinamidine synthase subunit PurQ / glutaminase